MRSAEFITAAPVADDRPTGLDAYVYLENEAGSERGWREYGLRAAENRHRHTADGSRQMWCVGDWLVAGQDRIYANLTKARVREMGAELTGYSRNTLRMAAAVARQFKPDMRINGLTWWHHLAVLGLDAEDREQLLTRSAEGEWSMDALRAEVRRIRTPGSTRRQTGRPRRLIRQVTQLTREEIGDELLAELRDWVHRMGQGR